MTRPTQVFTLALAAVALSACSSGGVESSAPTKLPALPGTVAPGALSPSPDTNTASDVPTTQGQVAASGVESATPVTLEPSAPGSGRRLTKTEYIYTIADILGVQSTEVERLVVPDSGGFGFRNAFEALLPSDKRTNAFSDAATAVAKEVALEKLTEFSSGCSETSPECGAAFVSAAGRMLFRRPLEDVEVERYARLFTVVTQAGDDFEVAARMVIEAMLQSPRFLYRLENTTRTVGDRRVVDGYERATRLSYLLWQSAPDAELLDAAASGNLEASNAQATVEAMVASPKFRRAVRSFAREWLQLYSLDNRTRDGELYPEFDDALKLAMEEETLTFVEKLVVEERAPFMGAFTTQALPSQGALAELYGTTPRPGLLTHASVLTSHSIADSTSIVDRGLFVLGKIFCQEVPSPPESLANEIAESIKNVDENLVQRDVLEQHRNDAKCSGCHSAFDPFGYAFEAFDGIGRFQTTDTKGNAIATNGEALIDGAFRPYADVTEFTTMVSQSALAKRCVVKQLAEFAFGRVLGSSDDSFVDDLTAGFDTTNQDLSELFKQVALTPAFQSYVPQDQSQQVVTPTAGAEQPEGN